HLDGLGMAGAPGGDLLIARILDPASGVSRYRRDHARHLLESFLGAPEAARGEGRLLELLRMGGSRGKRDGEDDPSHFFSSLSTASMTGWSRKHSRTLRSREARAAVR